MCLFGRHTPVYRSVNTVYIYCRWCEKEMIRTVRGRYVLKHEYEYTLDDWITPILELSIVVILGLILLSLYMGWELLAWGIGCFVAGLYLYWVMGNWYK